MRSGLRGEEMPKEPKVRSVCFAVFSPVLTNRYDLDTTTQIHAYLSSDTLASTSVSRVILPPSLSLLTLSAPLFIDVGPPNVLY